MGASSLRLAAPTTATTSEEQVGEPWLVEPLLVVQQQQQSPSSSGQLSSPPLTFLEVEFFVRSWMVFPMTCRAWTTVFLVGFAVGVAFISVIAPILSSSSPLVL